MRQTTRFSVESCFFSDSHGYSDTVRKSPSASPPDSASYRRRRRMTLALDFCQSSLSAIWAPHGQVSFVATRLSRLSSLFGSGKTRRVISPSASLFTVQTSDQAHDLLVERDPFGTVLRPQPQVKRRDRVGWARDWR